MFFSKQYLAIASLLLAGGSVLAQTEAEVDEQMRAAEMALQESARQFHEAGRLSEAETVQIETQMRQAEARLAAAARQIAQLSTRQMPGMMEIEKRFFIDTDRPMLGVNIGAGGNDGPVEGAQVVGVSPGGAADEAGLRGGDIITAINDESMSAASGDEANRKLLDFMAGVEAGDQLKVDYLRNGNVFSAEIEPRSVASHAFAFASPSFNVRMQPGVQFSPEMPPHVTLFSAGGSWGDMEMVALTERLGSYFGADEGLLVVRAPDDEALQLQDGDVIQSIGGRTPDSVSHAMRILGSYESGEKLDIVIMRDRRKRTLNIEMPDSRQSSRSNFASPVAPVRLIRPAVKPAKKPLERT